MTAGDVLAEVETDKATMDWENQVCRATSPSALLMMCCGPRCTLIARHKTYARVLGCQQACPPILQCSCSTIASLLRVHLHRPARVCQQALAPLSASAQHLFLHMRASLSALLMLQDDGFIAKILVAEGHKDILVGTPLLVLVEDEESVGAFSDYKPSDAAAPKPAASAEQPVDEPHTSGSSQAGQLLSAPASRGPGRCTPERCTPSQSFCGLHGL